MKDDNAPPINSPIGETGTPSPPQQAAPKAEPAPAPPDDSAESSSGSPQAGGARATAEIKAEFGEANAKTILIGGTVSISENHYQAFVPEAGEEYSISLF